MARRQKGGSRRKTRHKLQKRARMRGKITLTHLLQEFKDGERVRVLQEPAVQKGMPHPRFKNAVGVIIGKQGKSYRIALKDMNKSKIVISAPVHIKRL